MTKIATIDIDDTSELEMAILLNNIDADQVTVWKEIISDYNGMFELVTDTVGRRSLDLSKISNTIKYLVDSIDGNYTAYQFDSIKVAVCNVLMQLFGKLTRIRGLSGSRFEYVRHRKNPDSSVTLTFRIYAINKSYSDDADGQIKVLANQILRQYANSYNR